MSFKAFLRHLRALTICCAAAFAVPISWAAEDFLPPEQAFEMEARAMDAKTIEVRFKVAEGYYLYREPFKFIAEPGVQLGFVHVPKGKTKFDETFQKNVETFRDRLSIRVPVVAAPSSFKLTITSQGCADAGLCYPPMQTVVKVSLTGFGGDASVKAASAGVDLPGGTGIRRAGSAP